MSANEWFTLYEIAALRGLSYGYVKKLAHLHKWRRTLGIPRRYHILDVMRSFE